VRGEQKKSGDLDILVEFAPDAKISLLDFVKLES
jgi:predicted nucleotidyltransferase